MCSSSSINVTAFTVNNLISVDHYYYYYYYQIIYLDNLTEIEISCSRYAFVQVEHDFKVFQ